MQQNETMEFMGGTITCREDGRFDVVGANGAAANTYSIESAKELAERFSSPKRPFIVKAKVTSTVYATVMAENMDVAVGQVQARISNKDWNEEDWGFGEPEFDAPPRVVSVIDKRDGKEYNLFQKI